MYSEGCTSGVSLSIAPLCIALHALTPCPTRTAKSHLVPTSCSKKSPSPYQLLKKVIQSLTAARKCHPVPNSCSNCCCCCSQQRHITPHPHAPLSKSPCPLIPPRPTPLCRESCSLSALPAAQLLLQPAAPHEPVSLCATVMLCRELRSPCTTCCSSAATTSSATSGQKS